MWVGGEEGKTERNEVNLQRAKLSQRVERTGSQAW